MPDEHGPSSADDGLFPPANQSPEARPSLSRREFVAEAGAAGAGLFASQWLGSLAPSLLADPTNTPTRDDLPTGVRTVRLALNINGKQETVQIDPRFTLLDTLREHLHLTGTKKGCNHGQCGACTILVNGRRVNSCLCLAVQHDGDEITTIEGLAQGDELHPVQEAFIKHDGFQCGYCTPGQICSAVACLREGHVKDDAEIREWMSGNLCRCGAYTNIVAAIKEVRDRGTAV